MSVKAGCDIVLISRMKDFLKKEANLKFFSEAERNYILSKKNKEETAAGIFAAKEALGKALGCGLSGFVIKETEVLHKETGEPYFSFGREFEKNVSLSISHDGDYALAFVVIEEKQYV